MAATSRPAWYHNLAANPRAIAELGTEAGVVQRFDNTAQAATGAECDRLDFATPLGLGT